MIVEMTEQEYQIVQKALNEATKKRIIKTATINGKEVEFIGTQNTVKRRIRGEYVERLQTTCTADIYPECEWFPQVDFGDRQASFSCVGYEPDEPEFEQVDAIASAIIFELKGWEQDKTADELIAELNENEYKLPKKILESKDGVEELFDSPAGRNALAADITRRFIYASESCLAKLNDNEFYYDDVKNEIMRWLNDANITPQGFTNEYTREFIAEYLNAKKTGDDTYHNELIELLCDAVYDYVMNDKIDED